MEITGRILTIISSIVMELSPARRREMIYLSVRLGSKPNLDRRVVMHETVILMDILVFFLPRHSFESLKTPCAML